MAKPKSGIPPLTPYERIGMRVQKLLADPKVQKNQAISVHRREEEPVEDWERFLDDLRATDGITISFDDEGATEIGWKAYIDA